MIHRKLKIGVIGLGVGERHLASYRRIPECNEITLEFPKGTGKTWTSPEIDQAELFSPEDAKRKLREEQHPFVDRLLAILNEKGSS